MTEETPPALLCEICGKGPNEPGPLYRKNLPDGTPSIWRHNPCFEVVLPVLVQEVQS